MVEVGKKARAIFPDGSTAQGEVTRIENLYEGYTVNATPFKEGE